MNMRVKDKPLLSSSKDHMITLTSAKRTASDSIDWKAETKFEPNNISIITLHHNIKTSKHQNKSAKT